MSLRIRLARGGSKKRPFYRVVVADSRMPRDGRFIDKIGTYDPRLPKDSAERVKIDPIKAADWIRKGARPTDRVARFLGQITPEGADRPLWDWQAGSNPKKGEPGQKAKERAQEREEKRLAAEEAAREAAEAGAAAAEEPVDGEASEGEEKAEA